ncbi:MAG: hypothetical protein JNL12_11995, partial [Planctomycetes bacterium]|nr:hypothetical protein [Planctomycetota bacterium]
MDWLAAFALTCAVELPIVAAVAPGRRRRAALDAFGANLLTHPLAWYSVRTLLLSWTVVELAVLAVETVVYRTVTRLPWGR